jgi:hypothetical protein
VAVLFRHLRKEVIQSEFLPNGGDNHRTVFDGELHWHTNFQVRVARDISWESKRQAIAPFGDS